MRASQSRRARPAGPDSATRSAEVDTLSLQSEMMIAYFRVLLVAAAIVAAKIAPGVMFPPPLDTTGGALLIGCATAYNIFTAMASWKRWRLRYQRHLMLLMDIALISWWIQVSGPDRGSLFPLYYVVVVVAAIWFKVFGAVIVAALCSALYIALQWTGNELMSELIGPLPALFLLAVLGGVISETHDQERSVAQALRQRVHVYEREIDLSREIRRLLRPRALPLNGHLQLGAAERPSREVGGGDYYDAFPLEDGRLALCVADVSGKSIRAQSRLPLLKYALHAAAQDLNDPADVMRRLNKMLYEDLQPDLFITMIYAVVDHRHNELTAALAGHAAPIRFDTGTAAPADPPAFGPALGLIPDPEYHRYRIPLPPQSGGIVLFTDGVTNAMHREHGEFGVDRLCDLIANHSQADAQALAHLIVERVDEFEESSRSDDVAVVVVKTT